MNSQSIIVAYESIADLAHQMLVAARNDDWDTLLEIEAHCAPYVAKVTEQDTTQLDMTSEERAQQVALIQKILQTNKDIQALIEPSMQSLSSVIKNTVNERKLAKTYNVNPGG